MPFIDTVQVARNIETQLIETPFGNLPGKTSQDVTLAVIGILNSLRYVDVETTFRSLLDIYQSEQNAEVRKQIVDVIKHLAEYHLKIWNQAGPYVQKVLADIITQFSRNELHILRPIVLTVWRELLKPEMDSASFSADTVTFYTRALPVYEGVRVIRNKTIDGLITLFDSSSTEGEKREVVAALSEANRLPGRVEYSNELLQVTLEDTERIVELLMQRTAGQSYELLTQLEYGMFFEYQRARHLPPEHDVLECQRAAKNLMESILAFRDLINTDQQYVRYKTLVGFHSVFPFDWERETPDYTATQQYRMEQSTLYIDEVSEETAEEWYLLIERCVSTKSNDMATFPTLVEFLRQLSKAKPDFAVALVQRNNVDLMVFLSAILDGLYYSNAHDIYEALLKDYLDRDAFLTAIAFHCRSVEKDTADTVKKVLDKAIIADELTAVSESMIFAIEHHDLQRLPLIDNVFVPAMNYIVSKQDVQWIRRAYYLPAVEKFFYEMPSGAADLVLENLLSLKRIEHDAESILTPIAIQRPISIWSFFERRVKEKHNREDRYEAIPYELRDLRIPLVKDIDSAIASLQKWYEASPSVFWYTGGRLLQAVFPLFTDEMASYFHQIIVSGSEADYDFITRLLENYHGEPATYEVMKELIERLPENDLRLSSLYICLNSIDGAVSGEFGMVTALREKKEAIALWRNDSRSKVKKFAESYVKEMEQRIASEQRSSEMRRELRMRDYETEGE